MRSGLAEAWWSRTTNEWDVAKTPPNVPDWRLTGIAVRKSDHIPVIVHGHGCLVLWSDALVCNQRLERAPSRFDVPNVAHD